MGTREPIEDKRVLRKMPDGTWVVRPDIPRETSEVRVVDLRHDGIACIPALECVRKKAFKGTTCAEHVHDGCMEIVFCQRGTLVFEGMGITYPFHPGMVFVSRPDEPHRLSSFPQGMFIYNILVRIGKRGTSMLGLPSREADCSLQGRGSTGLQWACPRIAASHCVTYCNFMRHIAISRICYCNRTPENAIISTYNNLGDRGNLQ